MGIVLVAVNSLMKNLCVLGHFGSFSPFSHSNGSEKSQKRLLLFNNFFSLFEPSFHRQLGPLPNDKTTAENYCS